MNIKRQKNRNFGSVSRFHMGTSAMLIIFKSAFHVQLFMLFTEFFFVNRKSLIQHPTFNLRTHFRLELDGSVV